MMKLSQISEQSDTVKMTGEPVWKQLLPHLKSLVAQIESVQDTVVREKLREITHQYTNQLADYFNNYKSVAQSAKRDLKSMSSKDISILISPELKKAFESAKPAGQDIQSSYDNRYNLAYSLKGFERLYYDKFLAAFDKAVKIMTYDKRVVSPDEGDSSEAKRAYHIVGEVAKKLGLA